jgi:hypothetical protein
VTEELHLRVTAHFDCFRGTKKKTPLGSTASPGPTCLPASHERIQKLNSPYFAKDGIIMFETAVQEKRTSPLWGIIVGCAARAVLLGAGSSPNPQTIPAAIRHGITSMLNG